MDAPRPIDADDEVLPDWLFDEEEQPIEDQYDDEAGRYRAPFAV